MFFLWVGIRGCKLLLLTQRRTYRKHIELPPQYPNHFVHNAKRKAQLHDCNKKKKKEKRKQKNQKHYPQYMIFYFSNWKYSADYVDKI